MQECAGTYSLAKVGIKTEWGEAEYAPNREVCHFFREKLRWVAAFLEGHKQGREEGRAEERLANARSLKENDIPMDVIIKSLGLIAE